jgi:hypothetical protein
LDKNGKHGGYSCVSGLPSIVNGVWALTSSGWFCVT